jgi:hypothetical protein
VGHQGLSTHTAAAAAHYGPVWGVFGTAGVQNADGSVRRQPAAAPAAAAAVQLEVQKAGFALCGLLAAAYTGVTTELLRPEHTHCIAALVELVGGRC